MWKSPGIAFLDVRLNPGLHLNLDSKTDPKHTDK